MEESLEIIKKFYDKLPHFPDGRINYADSDSAPVLNVFVKCDREILLLKRSDKVGNYKGYWNTVAGYLDELKPIGEKALEEFQEELGLPKSMISNMRLGGHHKYFDEAISKTWIIFPVMIELKEKPEIKLDWEHDEYKWILPDELKNFQIVTGLDIGLGKVLQ